MRLTPIFFAFLLLTTQAHATSPGEPIVPLKTETLEALLVFIAASVDKGKVKGLEFAWVPPSIAPRCEGRSLSTCDNIERVRHTETVIDKNGNARTAFRALPPEAPNRVLTEWVTPESRYKSTPALLAKLANLPAIKSFVATFPNDTAMEKDLVALRQQNTIKAKVKWEVWPNGENFRILEILP